MASRNAKATNGSYRSRHVKKSAKGAGIYAAQSPGLPSGIHAPMAAKTGTCRCGRCLQS